MNKSNFSDIETKTSSLKNILNKKIIYSCPLFQRKYVWEITQWQELWDDILSIISNDLGNQNIIYLGAIILKNEDLKTNENFPKSLIIDGQQRLTTLYVILCVLSKILSENGKASEGKNIITRYLATPKHEDDIYAKILPTLEDQQYFNKLLSNLDLPISNIYQIQDHKDKDNLINSAFNYFEKEIKKYAKFPNSNTQLDMSKINTLQKFILERLFFICIQIDNQFIDENKIYEKLNTSGKQLEIIDYIRNKIFTNIDLNSYNDMENLYNNQWTTFEKSFGGNNKKENKIRNQYFFNFAMIEVSPNVKVAETFFALKKRWDDQNIDSPSQLQTSRKIINDLGVYHQPYLILRQIQNLPDFVHDDIKKSLSNLFKIGISEGTLPYTMRLLKNILDDKEQKKVTDHIRILEIIEIYFVRRGIVNDDATGIHGFFKSLWNHTNDNPQLVYDMLISGSSVSGISMPTNERILSNIKELTVHKGTAKYVLSEYEVHLLNPVHRSNIESNYPKATIEHVCPQDITPPSTWTETFTELEHNRTNNLIGNWILLTKSKNSSLGKKPWADKKKHYQETETIFHGPKEVSNYGIWTPHEIDKRTKSLGEFIIKKWELKGAN